MRDLSKRDAVLARIVATLEQGLATAETIAKSEQLTPRTVYRYIGRLRASGVPIVGERGVGYMLRSKRRTGGHDIDAVGGPGEWPTDFHQRRAAMMGRILDRLGEGVVTAGAIAKSENVAQRTVYHYIDSLRAAGHQIEGTSGVGYVLRRKPAHKTGMNASAGAQA